MPTPHPKSLTSPKITTRYKLNYGPGSGRTAPAKQMLGFATSDAKDCRSSSSEDLGQAEGPKHRRLNDRNMSGCGVYTTIP